MSMESNTFAKGEIGWEDKKWKSINVYKFKKKLRRTEEYASAFFPRTAILRGLRIESGYVP